MGGEDRKECHHPPLCLGCCMTMARGHSPSSNTRSSPTFPPWYSRLPGGSSTCTHPNKQHVSTHNTCKLTSTHCNTPGFLAAAAPVHTETSNTCQLTGTHCNTTLLPSTVSPQTPQWYSRIPGGRKSCTYIHNQHLKTQTTTSLSPGASPPSPVFPAAATPPERYQSFDTGNYTHNKHL